MEETPPLPHEVSTETPTHTPVEPPAELPSEPPAAAHDVADEAAEVATEAPTAAVPEVPTDGPATEPAAPPQPADLSPAACAAALAERFPALFTPGKPLPIKLRIQADIQARAPGVFSRKSMGLFLHRHTTSTAYIRALLAAQTRFDLDGQPAGEIATEHREAAVVELERRRQIVMAKRQAEREAQRNAARAADQEARAAMPPQPQAPPQTPQQPIQQPRPPRPPRADRPHGADRPGRPARPPRPDRPPRPEARGDRPPQPPQQHRPDRSPPRDRPAAPPQAPSAPLTPEQAAEHEARRARALLLRAFETSTISRANFCTLKRIDDATLEAQLQQARAERGERGDSPRR